MRKTVKIFGYLYTIRQPKTMYELGECISDRLLILLNRSLKGQQAESTLLHEAIHALDRHMNIGLKESQVLKLETGLYSFLVDNGIDLRPLVEETYVLKHIVVKPEEA